METDDHHFDSPRESENAEQVTDESPGQFFVIGNRLLFSTSSVSLSDEELKSLEEEVNKLDECLPEDEAEAKAELPIARSASDIESKIVNEKLGSPWKVGFLRKFRKGPTMNFQAAFHSSMTHLPSLKVLSKKFAREEQALQEDPPLPQLPSVNLDADFYYCFQNSWISFSLSELQEATNNFSDENIIGEGGYSKVYKAHLEDGQLAAVKRLIRGTTEDIAADYLSELGILVHVNHPNISSVIGYGVEGGMHIVLPLSVNGSLSSLLTGDKEKLTWNHRYNIAIGIASGLNYLHEGCQRRIIHRDIKSANILLTEDFEPKISDFGLAKWLPDQWTHITLSQFEGTFGYLPPEFFTQCTVDEKTDVYAFGVLLLELISGRPAIDEANRNLVMWARPLVNSNNIAELLDPSLGGVYDSEQLNRMISLAPMCVHHDPEERPKMNQALRLLTGNEGAVVQSNKKFQKRPALKRPYLWMFKEEKFDPPEPSNDRDLKSDSALEQENQHQNDDQANLQIA